jgi:hypothetical protein
MTLLPSSMARRLSSEPGAAPNPARHFVRDRIARLTQIPFVANGFDRCSEALPDYEG